MTTFADVVPMTNRALWWGVEISFDNFATVSYRYATHAGDVGGHHFDARIAGMGNIDRKFGQEHLPAATTFSMILNNTDFAADWLVNRATVASSVLKAKFKVYCGLSDDTANTYQATVLPQQVGVFVCMNRPRRNAQGIALSLADDSMGGLSDIPVPPTFFEWAHGIGVTGPGTTDANSVFDTLAGSVYTAGHDGQLLVDPTLPVPLQFGPPEYDGVPCGTYDFVRSPTDFDAAAFGAGQRNCTYAILVLATRETAVIDGNAVTHLRGVFRKDVKNDPTKLAGLALDIPETWTQAGLTTRIWKAYKTQTMTKDGYDWKLLWIAFNAQNYVYWRQNGQIGNASFSAPIPYPTAPEFEPLVYYAAVSSGAVASPVPNYAAAFAAFESFRIGGRPGSGIHGYSVNDPPGDAVNIMKDLVEYYSPLGGAGVGYDGTRFARAQLVTRLNCKGSITARQQSGVVTGDTRLSTNVSPYGVGTLRKTIAELAATADLDVFFTQAGLVALVAQGADFETSTTTYPAVLESRINNVEDRTPSDGERWAPYNRVFVQSAGGQLGPYDNTPQIGIWGIIVARVLQAKWWFDVIRNKVQNDSTATSFVWATRNLETVVRPIISFSTDLSILALELGDYFTMGWSRGGNNVVYADTTLWKLESVKISPNTGQCDVTAVWMGDLNDGSTYPYLLDNETLVIRAATGAATLTVTTGSTTVVRSAGSFITDGVAAGDIFLLRDSTEAAQEFARNRQLRVVSVTDATHVVLSDSVFGSAGAHVIAAADWKMLRGASTYPDAVSDAANYPSGGAMYGKVADTNGEYSYGAPTNPLKEG